MKIAYIILAHQYPEQLTRLILRLNTPTVVFLVHIDKKVNDGLYEQVTHQLNHFVNVHFLKRYKSYWGSFAVVQAILEGIKEIVENSIPCDYAVLLSGQDYPIKSNRYLEKFFSDHQGKSFINHFSLPAPPGWQNGGMDRIEYWHFRFFNRRFSFPHESTPFFKRQFPQGVKPFGGSAYWALTREAVEYIYNFTLEQPKLIDFFKFVDLPDELFFQTVLLNSPLRDTLINDDLKYIQWPTPTSAHPDIFGEKDFEKLSQSPKLFARKFSVKHDTVILDLIDQYILGFINTPQKD